MNKKEVKALEMKTKENDLEAIKTLAQAYFNGDGVKKSKGKAIELYTQGAELGDGECAYILGDYYERGLIVRQDYNKSRHFYMIAAKAHHPKATYKMGYYLDYEEAKKLGYHA